MARGSLVEVAEDEEMETQPEEVVPSFPGVEGE